MSREIKAIKEDKLVIKDGKVLMIYEKKITKYGNGAKIDAPKKFLGKSAYVVVVNH